MSKVTTELNKALAALQEKPILAKKDEKGAYSDYATLESVWEACRDQLNKQGLVISQYPKVKDGNNLLVTKLIHTESGEEIKSEMLLIMARQDMQALGSAITYARRYALLTMVGIIPEDDDGENASQPAQAKKTQKTGEVSSKQVNFIMSLLEQLGASTTEEKQELFQEITGHESMRDLNSQQASDAIESLQQHDPDRDVYLNTEPEL